ncbi:YD repeat-containing protein [Flagellimonas taeanensis]|uniref:YD repeat-containing protein n=1 Tax=Flagellimonas taeanensis TaxID=1005926 RepID=A0A1M7ATJ6_9FLAO|nr:hypothetical protein [Allomuricauda taeanensis]SFC35921.1 YD repeat-containing protein [Allomuricauda taeanensis]SHL46025.1 YD repeat-containing protein [Allomuricauda taeanensis]
MRKIQIIILFWMAFQFSLSAQNNQSNDIQAPELSPFSMGQGGIQGAIANSVQEVTGKVNFSVPIASIASRGVSYPVALTYNGSNVFEQAQYMNRFSTQSTLGVGWSLSHPKIMADHKGTASRDDDEYYLLDGANNTRLINTKKQVIQAPGTGDSYMDFELEKYAPYKVRYKIRNADFFDGYYITTNHDYWEITDDKGVTYIYGNTDNTRENVVAWGNWIGDSKNTSGDAKHTTGWNISKIQDQWGNNLTFTYSKIEGSFSSSGVNHTEASYLAQITASVGGKIVFGYGNKASTEYYEPHKEQSEPDAYQEHFETKYLSSVTTYDRENQLVYTYNLGYDIVKKYSSNDRNRYLTSITQEDKDGTTLPPLIYEYYTTGYNEGGLKKITYPTGGSITYTYTEKTAFNAGSASTLAEGTLAPGYYIVGRYVGEDYALRIMSNGTLNNNGRDDYQFKFEYDYWVGESWKRSEFIFPELVTVDEYNNSHEVENLKFTAGRDFFAFLIFNKSTDKGSLYLFHKNRDGVSWNKTEYRNLNLNCNNNYSNQFPYKDPALMSGDGFVAIGENESTYGRLYRYVWNGTSWNSDILNQGIGTYYYGATNNYIISLDENGNGTDLVTSATHPDYYYIHYLDSEKKWQTKSWSSAIDNTYTYVAATNAPSYFYASNSMAGFMADNNPEYILRWDTDYNLLAVDNYLGQETETYPLIPVMNNMFAIHTYASGLANRPIKAIGFNGSSWVSQSFSGNTTYGLGDNTLLTSFWTNSPNHQSYIYRYNPNTHQWSNSSIGPVTINYGKGFGLGFFVVNNYGYRMENTGTITSLGQISNYFQANNFVFNNLSGVYHEYNGGTNPNAPKQGSYFHMNKRNGSISQTILSVSSLNRNYGNRIIPQFGTDTQNYMSSNMFYLDGAYFERLVDAEVNKLVKNIVVSRLDIDNGDGEIRKILYTHNNGHTLPDDHSTFYGKVTVENKGLGSGNIGKTEKYFNTGEDDVQLAGLPTMVKVLNKNGLQVSETETVWKKFTKNFINSSYKTVGVGYYIRPETTIEKLIFGTDEVITETDYYYNSLGFLSSTSKVNSNGETETSSIQYAYQNYTFVNDRNMLAFPYETRTQINGDYVAVEQSIWKLESNRAYVYQNKSGSDYGTLRLNNKITKVDSYGNILESNNGQGIYKTVLYGYGNLYPVATIINATYSQVAAQLDVTYSQLQNLTGTLETELVKLPTRLPKSMVNINLYDKQGRVVRSLDERKEAVSFLYDSFGRLEYSTDANNKVIERKEYNYGSN